MKTHTPATRILRSVISLCLILTLLLSLGAQAFAVSPAAGSDYLQRAAELFRQAQVKTSEEKDPDEVVRALVVTDVPTAVEKTGDTAYTVAAQSAETQSLRTQESLIRKVERITGSKVINQSAYLVSAFSICMKRSQMEQVAKLDGVVSVSEVTTFASRMTTAKDMTSAMELWKSENGGYTGEGIVVAVIDSGVNYTHPDMQMREDAKLKYTQADMQAKIAELGYGAYYSDKVPFGYSYVSDGSVENKMLTHGLHVSGIVAANGDEENGGIKGVAPDAQIFAMKVFSNTGSGYNDDIIRAVEDAVKLGADILNLSLGSTAGFYDDVEYLQKALRTAQENGVLACVAAGNDGASSSEMGTNANDWGVIDTGAVSSPSVYPGALSVASVDNAFTSTSALDIFSGEEQIYSGQVMDFSEGKYTDWSGLGEVQIVDCGYGDMMTDLFPLLGKTPTEPFIALVQRGNDIPFSNKISMPIGMLGAKAVIIYNNETTDEVPMNVSAENAKNNTAILVSGNTGAKLKEIAAAGGKLTFKGLYDTIVANTATGGEISSFSSWGSTPTLDIKPEISAPGGNIRSVSKGTDYEVMSGTSMATPYVAGSAALVLEALQQAAAAGTLSLGEESLNDFLKNTLMNTADPIMDGSSIFSVRQQGSGMIDPLEAAENRVIATHDGIASIALKEVGQTTSFTVTLTNYGTEAKTYALPASSQVYTDYTDPASADYYVVPLSGASVSYGASSVTVPAGGTASVTCTLNIPASAAQNHYVEAFVSFDGDIDLSLPLLGFYGDWYGCQRIVDLPAWDEDNILTNFYDYMPVTTLAAGSSYAGLDAVSMTVSPEHTAFSPNGDGDFDTIQPMVGLLRSSEEIIVDILDANGKVVRQINRVGQTAKALGIDAYESRNPSALLTNTIAGDGTWDGTRYDAASGKNMLCEEGQYTMRIRARMPGSEKYEETLLPVKLDLTAPEVHIVSAAPVDGKIVLSYKAADFSGIMNTAVVYVNGDEQIEFTPSEDADYDEATGIYTVVLDSASYASGKMNEIALVCADYALNGSVDILYTNIPADATVYFSNITNDDSLSILRDVGYQADYDVSTGHYYNFRNCTAEIRGIVSGSVAKLTVNGVEASFDERSGFAVTVPVAQPGELTLEVIATDAAGSEVFHAVKPALYDVQKPSVLTYVSDANGEWDDSMLWTTNFTEGGYIYATKYESDQLVPLRVQVEDESLQSFSVEWVGSNMKEDDFFYWLFERPISAEVHKTDYTPADLDENHQLALSLPFVEKENTEYDEETGTPIPGIIHMQLVRVTAVDGTGAKTVFNAVIYDTVEGKKMLDRSGYIDVRNSDDAIYTGFEALEPLWSADEEAGDSFIIDPSWLSEDGMLHVKGTLARDTNCAELNGVKYWPEEGSKEVEFDIPIHDGLNLTYIRTYATVSAENDLETTMRFYLFYLNDEEPSVVKFDDEAIEEGAVLYTNQETYPLPGKVLSMYGLVSMKINGDQILYPQSGINVEGDYVEHKFSYGARLTEGENPVHVELSDGTGFATEMNFTIVLDTVAPNAPVISQDDTGAITITADEEDAAIYYSYDGQEWILYTGAFAPAGEKIYAKAVDKAGNESAEGSFALVAPVPEKPVITVDGNNVTITAGEGLTIYYSFDGENWLVYSAPFAMKQNGKVYAKAVDANGMESAVVSQIIAIGSVKTGDSVLPFAMLTLAISAMAIALLLVLRRKLRN